jgi:CSLREA domain-containing protein
LRCLLILLIVLLPAGPFATTFPVTKTADTNGSCTPGNCSLREAIGAANANPGADDVPVPAGTYLLTLGQLTVSDDLSIAGAGQTTTIIDGNASFRVFDIEATSGVVEISGVTIQNGYAYYHGGGIRAYGNLSLTNITVSGNAASGLGGGIYFFSESGYSALTNSTVSGNTARGSGGGIYSDNLTLTNSTVSGNIAHYGGGIQGYDLTLTHSTVSGNTAYYNGGGIYSDNLTLTNSTVSGNYGSGISGRGTVTLTNTIVADNIAAANCNSPINSLGYNLTDDTSCGFTATGDLVVADAMLGPLQDNGGPTDTHDLLPGSPAIDAGSMDCPPPDTDQRGVSRPQGTDCDIGAVEFVPEPGSWATLIAGAATLALLYRRRQHSVK